VRKATSHRRTRSKEPEAPSQRPQLSRDLEELVGGEVYRTWILMLRELVPHGRTHRLSVLVAGMVQYASTCPASPDRENTVAALLEDSAGLGLDEEQAEIVLPVIEQLFKDAGVNWKRTNARGESYSIAEESMEEFLRWNFMPWE